MFGSPLTTSGVSRRWPRRGWSVPILTSVGLLTLAACTSGGSTAPTATTLVSRATISNGVNASGSLSAITTQDLGFSKGGQLKSVSVKVGDKVTEGQTLAKIDNFALKQAVKQQQANLDAQVAALGRIAQNPALASNNSTLGQAKDILAATQRQVKATKKADASAVHRANKQLDVDEKAQNSAEDLRHDAKEACDDATSGSKSSAENIQKLQDAYLEALRGDDPVATQAALTELNVALQTNAAAGTATACSGVASAEAGVTAAKQRTTADRTAVEAAKQREKTDLASGKVAIESSRAGVVAAQNTVNQTGSDRPFTIDQQRALVDNAESLLDSADNDLDNATLKAPFAGTVAAINGTVGEYLSPSTGTTALAPGSGAAIPGVDSGGGAGGGTATVTRPGGSQFLVISNINRLQVVLPFEQSDAAKIKPKQKVSVGFDAVPDLIESGTVSSVAPTSTSISGVISYYVTARLDKTDPRLKDGQTARVMVVTTERKNVLSVPNDAVRHQGTESAVILVDQSGAQQTVTFQPGVVGPDRTEVLSGLTEGQRIVSSKAN